MAFRKKKIIPLIWLLFSTPLFSQQTTTTEIDSLLAQSERLLKTQTDSALKLAFKAAELSQTNGSATHLVRSYAAIGDGYDRCVGVLQSVVEEIVEAEAVAQNEVGAGDVAQLAGLEIGVVRILIRLQEDDEVDAVAPDVLCEVPYLSRDRDYVWLLRVTIASAAGSEQQGQKREREEEEFHVHHLVETNSHLQMRCYLS